MDIDHVDFSYDKSKSLIEDFNLQVESGMRIAIVGPTGCGKTTFINLLMRFYDVDSGKICIDGKPIDEISPTFAQKELRYGASRYLDQIRYCP